MIYLSKDLSLLSFYLCFHCCNVLPDHDQMIDWTRNKGKVWERIYLFSRLFVETLINVYLTLHYDNPCTLNWNVATYRQASITRDLNLLHETTEIFKFFYFQHLLINISSLSVFEIFNEFLLFILNKSDNSPIEHARKSPNLRTTRMSHGVTNPFIGAFRYTDMLKSGFLSLTIQSEKKPLTICTYLWKWKLNKRYNCLLQWVDTLLVLKLNCGSTSWFLIRKKKLNK